MAVLAYIFFYLGFLRQFKFCALLHNFRNRTRIMLLTLLRNCIYLELLVSSNKNHDQRSLIRIYTKSLNNYLKVFTNF